MNDERFAARPSGGLTTADLAGTAVREPEQEQMEREDEAADREPRAPDVRDADAAPAPQARMAADRPDGRAEPLFAADQAGEFKGRWTDIQVGFVDEPRQAVEQADALVAEVMKRLAEVFANERSTLESQWSRGGDVSTEDLRVALQRYRSFFDRLLSV